MISHYEGATLPLTEEEAGDREIIRRTIGRRERRRLTKRAARLGKVFELDSEPDALASRTSRSRNRPLDVAHQRCAGEKGLLGQRGLELDALRIVNDDGGIFRGGTPKEGGGKDRQESRRPHNGR